MSKIICPEPGSQLTIGSVTSCTFLQPDRVRKIALKAMPATIDMVAFYEYAINSAAPEIARAVLEMAAKRFEDAPAELYAPGEIESILRQIAKEITDAD